MGHALGRTQGELRGVLRAGFEGFNLRAINIDGHGLVDDVHADDQTVPLFFRYEYAVSSSEQTTLNPYPHAFNEVRIRTTGEAMLHQGAGAPGGVRAIIRQRGAHAYRGPAPLDERGPCVRKCSRA